VKPARHPGYLQWIRTLPCSVCRTTRDVEAAHTGPRGLSQKSSDLCAIPLCARHHRTGKDSYHKLGPRKFSEVHHLDLAAMVARLSAKPRIRVESGAFREPVRRSGVRTGNHGGGSGAGDPPDERTPDGDPGQSGLRFQQQKRATWCGRSAPSISIRSVRHVDCGKLQLVCMSKTQIETFKPPSADDPALREVVRRLFEGYHPLRIYLFGSAARGDAGPDSDYNIQ